MVPTVLRSRWVTLEPLAAAHFDDLARVAADPRVWALTLRDGCGPAFAGWFADATAGGRLAYAVRSAAGELVGSTSYLDLNPLHRTVEIGNTWYAVAAQGTAVNPACKRLLHCHAFEALGLTRVQFQVDARNARSQAAVLKLGATREGLLRRHKVTYTGWVRDTVVFSVLAEEWPAAVRARLDERLEAFSKKI
jgi:RimJ/RimL family protein N-acetyltransferase